MLHPGVRRTRVPGNRAWRQLVRHLFTAAAFAVFLRLGGSFRLAADTQYSGRVDSLPYHLSIAWSSSCLSSFPTAVGFYRFILFKLISLRAGTFCSLLIVVF
jgi:hypothetical protein